MKISTLLQGNAHFQNSKNWAVWATPGHITTPISGLILYEIDEKAMF